jgi:group I intron endonuclease
MSAMIIYSIYKCVNNINGKVYIGFASNWQKRILRHKNCYKNSKENKILYKSIRKYGWEKFQWEIIYQSKDYDYCLNVMEEHFIREYNSHYIDGNGYNMSYGGEGQKGNSSRTNMPHSNHTKIKISIKNKGKHAWNRKKYLLISAEGEQHIINSSYDVIKYGLNISSMKSSLQRNKFIKGWKLSFIEN